MIEYPNKYEKGVHGEKKKCRSKDTKKGGGTI
jgi:hypothetical protein